MLAGFFAAFLVGQPFLAAADDQANSGLDDGLSFQVTVTSGDPFDFSNQSNPADSLKKVQVRRGQVLRVYIQGTVTKKGFHTYPVSKQVKGQKYLSFLTLEKSKELIPLPPIFESEPILVQDKDAGPLYEYTGTFTWSQDVLVMPSAKPGPASLAIRINTQICNDKGCLPRNYHLIADFDITSEDPIPLTPELQALASEKITLPPTTAGQPDRSPGAGLISTSHEEYKAGLDRILARLIFKDSEPLDLLAFILAGIFWGGVSLITPCVFPMIPITVSFFLKQSEKEHHRPITMALVYSATIVVVLTLAAAFLLSVFRLLSINPIMNYALGALFVFFALSLFGMYDIELPSSLAQFTSSKEGQGGMIGTIFMALTFTIISFACVAPFLGGFGGTAGTSDRPIWHNLLGGLAFSLTFASPFFILALFPTMLRKLPKSGSWLNSVKVVMGFLELAAAF
jgi:thiol:disulfide interchange protein